MEKRIQLIQTTFDSELSTSNTFGSIAEGAEKASPKTNLKGGPNTGGWTALTFWKKVYSSERLSEKGKELKVDCMLNLAELFAT